LILVSRVEWRKLPIPQLKQKSTRASN
jgi:hypothetical protein